MPVYASLDLGGTRLKAVIGRDGPRVLASRSVDTEAAAGSEHVLDRMATLIEELAAETGARVEGVAVGCPGLVDRGAGVSLFLPNLPGQWRGVPVAARLGARLRAPVHLLNDVRMATFGELAYGYGRRSRDAGRATPTLVLLALGTGVGGGVVVDGVLRLGAAGAAGEIGHVAVEPEGLPCSCGSRGSVVPASQRATVLRFTPKLRASSACDRSRASALSQEASSAPVELPRQGAKRPSSGCGACPDSRSSSRKSEALGERLPVSQACKTLLLRFKRRRIAVWERRPRSARTSSLEANS